MLEQSKFDAKAPSKNNGYLKAKNIIKEKHKPLKLVEIGENERIKEAIKERENVSLRESFN